MENKIGSSGERDCGRALEAIVCLSEEANSTQNGAHLLESFTRTTCHLLEAESTFFVRFWGDVNNSEVVAHFPDNGAGAGHFIDLTKVPELSKVFQQRSTAILEPEQVLLLIDLCPGLVGNPATMIILIAPAFKRECLVGAFCVVRSRTRPFDDADCKLVRVVAAQAALVLENDALSRRCASENAQTESFTGIIASHHFQSGTK